MGGCGSIGAEKIIDVIDVGRQADCRMRLGDFVAYLGGARRDRVLNVISLEFSDTRWVMSYPAGDLSSMSWYLPVCPSIPLISSHSVFRTSLVLPPPPANLGTHPPPQDQCHTPPPRGSCVPRDPPSMSQYLPVTWSLRTSLISPHGASLVSHHARDLPCRSPRSQVPLWVPSQRPPPPKIWVLSPPPQRPPSSESSPSPSPPPGLPPLSVSRTSHRLGVP